VWARRPGIWHRLAGDPVGITESQVDQDDLGAGRRKARECFRDNPTAAMASGHGPGASKASERSSMSDDQDRRIGPLAGQTSRTARSREVSFTPASPIPNQIGQNCDHKDRRQTPIEQCRAARAWAPIRKADSRRRPRRGPMWEQGSGRSMRALMRALRQTARPRIDLRCRAAVIASIRACGKGGSRIAARVGLSGAPALQPLP